LIEINPSPIQTIRFANRSFYLKRDDLLHPDFSGNKARKFYSLLQKDLSRYKKIISHGSNQSNAMYSLSVLAKMKNIDVDYYVSHIPPLLKQNPAGNYKYALQNGMQIIEGALPLIKDDCLFVPEGGAYEDAQEGVKLLAYEIESWAKQNGFEKLAVFLPSGTGTTALYLQKYSSFDIYTCACVGDDSYLQKQFNALEQTNHPTILAKKQKYGFGKLYKNLYLTYKKLMDETHIEFDLLYDPIGWETLLNYSFDMPVVYIHQGGIKGNETMIERYRRKFENLS
jgi:1-aminocyclopropane-1-carboxylate deaminase/D-cysteine desulfhydrase-like pyridoxal-dependent ACC family enzyme